MDAGPFVYQCKLRRGLPSYLRDWLRGITAAGERHGGSTGVVVWKAPGALDDDAVVLLGSRIGNPGMVCRILKVKSPPGVNPAGLDSVHGNEARKRTDTDT